MMSKYLKNFVTGHGITFERSKRNIEAFEKAMILWNDIASTIDIHGQSVIMLCGAKANGKSSLLRHLVNQYVFKPKHCLEADFQDIDMTADDVSPENLDDKYAYLVDFDPGQSELTSPAIVSAHIIRSSAQPLKTPSYLNVGQHESIILSSVGGTNMSVNPRMYIENCRYVFSQVLEHQKSQSTKRPIFINTMGFIRNVGLAMLTDLIKICRPTNLIVLNVGTDPMRTVYADLSPSAIDVTRANFFYETNHLSQKKLKYVADVRDLGFTFVDSTSIASKNRTALQLAYVASMPETLYKPLMQLSPKWLSLQSIFIYCASSYPLKEGIVLELLYHSWIQLVKLRKKSNVLESLDNANKETVANDRENTEKNCNETFCKVIDDVGENILYGCGIVSDIDLEQRKLAIITPLDQNTLDNCVDCVIKPLSIQVPRELLQEETS